MGRLSCEAHRNLQPFMIATSLVGETLATTTAPAYREQQSGHAGCLWDGSMFIMILALVEEIMRRF
jgi:hypothetical protein